MKKGLKTPLRYPGGKSRAVTKMGIYFPNLRDYTEYREPFLGGGSVAIYVSQMYPHLKITVNDLYEPLINFWSNLQMFGEELSKELFNLKTAHPNPDSARNLFNESKEIINDNTKTINLKPIFGLRTSQVGFELDSLNGAIDKYIELYYSTVKNIEKK